MTPLLVLVALAHPTGAAPADVERIDTVCHATEVASRGSRGLVRVFAEMSGAVLPKPRQGDWRELDTEAALQALADGERPPNTEAVVRTTPTGTFVSMYFQDASASWAHVVDYCYRPVGTLARVRGTFNSYKASFTGTGVRRRRTIYFDAQGAVVHTLTRVSDLDTDKPRAALAFMDEDDPVYPSLRALPFSSSLVEPVSAADLDPNGVLATVHDHLPALRACYERALRRKPGLAGKVVAHWTIDGEGRVTAFSWQLDQMHSADFGACAQKVVEKWRFPPPRGGSASVSFPFVFNTSGADVTAAPTVSSGDPPAR